MQAQDIGVWEYIFGFISLLSVVTNSLIMAFHSTWMRNKFESIYGDNEDQILVARLLFVLMFEVSYIQNNMFFFSLKNHFLK